jgi:cell division septal protein FtsQ
MRVKRIAAWAVPTLLIAGAAYLFGYSDLIQVKSISISSTVQSPEIETVIAKPIFNLRVGAHLARVNVRGAESALRNIGWVERAKISRNWFSGKVSISVTGRKAVARVIADGAGENSYIDLNGFIYRDSAITDSLPQISIADSKMSAIAASFITKIPSELIAQMQSLSLTSDGNFTMKLSLASNKGQNLMVRWGNIAGLETKLQVYEKLIALPENKSITAIDLSEPKFPIVKK